MTCKHCGAKMRDGQKFCPHCGKSLSAKTARNAKLGNVLAVCVLLMVLYFVIKDKIVDPSEPLPPAPQTQEVTDAADTCTESDTQDAVYVSDVSDPQDAVEDSGEEPAGEEWVMMELQETGVYTLYHGETQSYLAYREQMLGLAAEPDNWKLLYTPGQGCHVYAHGTDLLLDIDNAHIAPGTTIKLWPFTGYDAQLWTIMRNPNGTVSLLYSGDHGYCLGMADGQVQLQRHVPGDAAQEWQLTDVSDTIPQEYLAFTGAAGVVELQLPLDIEATIPAARLQQWADELERAYDSYAELTGYRPFSQVTVEAYRPIEGRGNTVAYATSGSSILRVDDDFLRGDLAKMAQRDCDWNFCVLHEMGHIFDFNQSWNFEAELMTDLKLAYVLERNGVAAAPSEFPADTVFFGAEIADAYGKLGRDFSQEYNVFACTERFLRVKEEVGWEPFRQTFQELRNGSSAYPVATAKERLETFVNLLSSYSGRDVKGYFTADEWASMVRRVEG